MPRLGHHRALNPTVYRLVREGVVHLGTFSTEALAMKLGEYVVAREAGLARLRQPTWEPTKEGAKALRYRSWYVEVLPECLDAEAR